MQAPERSKITGMRAVNFGDLFFIDHVDISFEGHPFLALVLIDASSNLLWATSQKNKEHEETISKLIEASNQLNVRPKAIVGDDYFMGEKFMNHYSFNNIKPIALGPWTPWPNRAEAAVKTFKKQVEIMYHSLRL